MGPFFPLLIRKWVQVLGFDYARHTSGILLPSWSLTLVSEPSLYIDFAENVLYGIGIFFLSVSFCFTKKSIVPHVFGRSVIVI